MFDSFPSILDLIPFADLAPGQVNMPSTNLKVE